MKEITIILFWSLFSFISSKTPTWKIEESSKEITTTASAFPVHSEAVFESTSIKTYLDGSKKMMVVNSGSGTNTIEIPFLQIDSYVMINNIYYICPSDIYQSHVYRYFFYNNTYDELPYPQQIAERLPPKQTTYEGKEWQVRCMHRSKNQANYGPITSFISPFIGIDYVYWYNERNNENNNYGKWGNQMSRLEDYILDIHIEEDTFYDSNQNNYKYYGYFYFYNAGSFSMRYGKFNIDDGDKNEPHWTTIGKENNKIFVNKKDYGSTKIYTDKKSEGVFDTYIMTYGEEGYSLSSASTTNKGANWVKGTDYTIPLDFSPDTFYFTDFEFINESTNFYYQVKTSSGQVYWGFGELNIGQSYARIVFNSNDPITSISPFKDSTRGALVTTSTNSYFVCPYEFSSSSPLTCNLCPSGKTFFINSNYKNECVDSTSPPANMTLNTTTGEYQCNSGYFPSSNSSGCLSCYDLGGYTVGSNCETECDTTKGFTEIDATNSIRKCTYCYLETGPLYFYDGQCYEENNLPSNTFITNDTYKIAEKCADTCATCKDTANNCLTCSGIYFLLPGSNECSSDITNPPSGYPNYGIDKTDPNNQKWVNCQEVGLVRYENGVECVDKSTQSGFYEVGEIDGVDYGIIAKCHQNCETCGGKGDDVNNNCTLCKANTFLLGTICVDDCNDERYFYDTSKRECINCVTKNLGLNI